MLLHVVPLPANQEDQAALSCSLTQITGFDMPPPHLDDQARLIPLLLLQGWLGSLMWCWYCCKQERGMAQTLLGADSSFKKKKKKSVRRENTSTGLASK